MFRLRKGNGAVTLRAKKKPQPDDVNPSLLIKFVTLPTFLGGGDAKKMFY